MKKIVTYILAWFVTALLINGTATSREAVTLITAEQIKTSGVGSLPEVLNQVPGVSAGDASISIRGSYKIKVFVDNNCINDPTSTIGGVKWESVNLHQAVPHMAAMPRVESS